MPDSMDSPAFAAELAAAVTPRRIQVAVNGQARSIPTPFPSPADWRDRWIYFLLVDRFNNPAAPPRGAEPYNAYQGGTLEGVRQQLSYLETLGVGAIWLSPVLRNPPWFNDYWGGYGIQDFLTVEPRFCSDPVAAAADSSLGDSELRALVDEAHARRMYVILDIVLNHTGDLFNYEGARDSAPWSPNREYSVYWRDQSGRPQGNWTDVGTVGGLTRDEGIWPQEFQRNDYFRRRGVHDNNGDDTQGDFDRLKELVTEYLVPGTSLYPVRNRLIQAYQYLIGKFDLDGFRIDTLQYVEADFARVFGNAMREFGLAIGKANFFTFGEVWQDDDEAQIARFVGRNTEKDDELIGVDAAIDFPVRRRLFYIAKGQLPPSALADHLDYRRQALRTIVSSHGDAGRNYVTFLDNHDVNERFHNPAYPEQSRLALACLMTLQGIPCVYYGEEQGLDGRGDRREYVREALWRGGFVQNGPMFQWIRSLSDLRRSEPALRYGRQYFRPVSGDGVHFGVSPYTGGVMAYSRLLNDREVLVVANTGQAPQPQLYVLVDANLNPTGKAWRVLLSSAAGAAPGPVASCGACQALPVSIAAGEVQVLGPL